MLPPIRHVACCVDDSEAARRALQAAHALAERDGARLSVLHAVPPVESFVGGRTVFVTEPERAASELREGARRWLVQQLEDLPGAEPVMLEVDHGPAAVCDWAADHGCDLLVAAPHRGVVPRVRLGSFAGYLTHHAPCSLLLVRAPEDARE